MATRQTFIAPAHRYFLAVAEAGSVRAAARALNVAASAISRQIIALERELGLPLFERGARNFALTPAGTALRAGLFRAVQENDSTVDVIDGLRGLTRGLLRIASVESISVSFLPDLLQDFAKAYPGIETAVTITGSDAVTTMVREHAADVGLTFNPTSLDGLESVLTRDFEIGAIVAPGHPLARARSLTLGECLVHRLAWPAKGLSIRQVLDRARGKRKPAVPGVECNSLRFMAAMARRGDCIAFQPRIGIEQDLASGDLVWIPLTDRSLRADRFVVVCRKALGARAGIDTFLGHLSQRLAPVRKK